jgi:hypothetical protein
MVLSESVAAQLAPLARETELAQLRELGDPALIAPRLPDDLLDQLTATGTQEQVLDSLRAIADSGVDAIAFVPIGPDPDEAAPTARGPDRFRIPRLKGTPRLARRTHRVRAGLLHQALQRAPALARGRVPVLEALLLERGDSTGARLKCRMGA